MIEDSFPRHLTQSAVEVALMEDLGLAGDVTGNTTTEPDECLQAEIRSRAAGVIAGLPLAVATFRALSPAITIDKTRTDGETVLPGDVIMRLEGNSRAILAAERVALNYLGHLSGVATLTRAYVKRIEGTNAAICCTRKTLPGLRAFQKYAVRAGGGQNHRFGLDDAILIKDNHIASSGGVGAVLERVRKRAGHMLRVEIEVDNLIQLEEVLGHKIDAVLLDNMAPEELRRAVKLINGRVIAEASGGVNLETVRAIAESGVDLISVGALTHSVHVLDLGLDIR